MNSLAYFSLFLFFPAVFCFLLLGLYPMLLVIRNRLYPRPIQHDLNDDYTPQLSVIVVFRNAESLVVDKIENLLELDYPAPQREIICFSDGSTDCTLERMQSYQNHPGIKILSSNTHKGKAYALNQAAKIATGEILVFTDADALMEHNALRELTKAYTDKTVGGACGQRMIKEKKGALYHGQHSYISLDSRIKRLESQSGSITSNDGKIYSIRRKLFRPFSATVTDDLFMALHIVSTHHRFIFEPKARAHINLPSRSPRHEIARRRRIVNRSLCGILEYRCVLNPFSYGFFALGLFINKVLRRAVPFLLILLFFACVLGAGSVSLLYAILLMQLMFYGASLASLMLGRFTWPKSWQRIFSVNALFLAGLAGTFLGIMDLLRGRRIAKWNPIKNDHGKRG